MSVKELIRELRKYPGDAIVAWADHDQELGEINGRVGVVEGFEPEEAFDPEYCQGVGVVLRPY